MLDSTDSGSSPAALYTLDQICSTIAMANAIRNIDVHFSYLLPMAVSIGMKVSQANDESRALATNTKNLVDWLKAPVQLRRAYFNKNAMKIKFLELNPRSPLNKLTEISLRADLAQHYTNNPDDNEVPVPSKQSRSTTREGFNLVQKMQLYMLQSAYMNPLKGKGKLNANKGTLLEPIIMKQYAEEVNNGMFDGISITSVVDCPMVGTLCDDSEDNNFAKFSFKGSADYIVECKKRTSDGTGSYLEGIEIKARVTNKTMNAEAKNLRQAVKKYEARDARKGFKKSRHDRNKKFFSLNWNDPLLFDFIQDKKELCQMLHLSSLYNISRWTLVIGDHVGRVITGIRVAFGRKIRNAWKRSIYFCCKVVFQDFFNEDYDGLKPVIAEVQVNKTALDLRSLQHDFWLYRHVIENCLFPLPTTKRILPTVAAYWNIKKPGSDTRSKIAASAYFHPPTKKLPGKLNACNLAELYVQIYRLFQLGSATQPMIEYRSLRNWRECANQRCSYKKALVKITGNYTSNIDPMYSTPVDNNTMVATTNDGPSTRSTQSVFVIKAGNVTGTTPSREAMKTYQRLQGIKKEDRTTVQQMLIDRRHRCTGNLVRVDESATKASISKLQQQNNYNKRSIVKAKGVCIVCKKDICRYYCTKCNHYFCMGKQCPLIDQGLVIRMKNKLKKKTTTDTSDNNSFKDIYCIMDCFRFAHPNAFGDPTLFDSLQLVNDNNDNTNREGIPKVSTTKKRKNQSSSSSTHGRGRGISATATVSNKKTTKEKQSAASASNVLPGAPRKKARTESSSSSSSSERNRGNTYTATGGTSSSSNRKQKSSSSSNSRRNRRKNNKRVASSQQSDASSVMSGKDKRKKKQEDRRNERRLKEERRELLQQQAAQEERRQEQERRKEIRIARAKKELDPHNAKGEEEVPAAATTGQSRKRRTKQKHNEHDNTNPRRTRKRR